MISNFSMSSNSVSFDISGNFPNPAPQSRPTFLFFVNPNVAASPGFALNPFFEASTQSWTGSQSLHLSLSIATGNPNFGDYFYVPFQQNFTVGEAINGTVQATWTFAPAFDPAVVSSLNLFWGESTTLPTNPSTQPSAITGGTFLTSVVVPEPSTYALLLMTGAGALWWARGRR
jgi:hypothetical protein